MMTISLDDYIIQSITMYDNQYTGGYTELYSPNEYDQTQAFECLEGICEEEDVVSSIGQIKEVEDEKLSGLAGPKRIEITLKSHNGILPEKKLVVTDVMPPSGHYKEYSVRGRQWQGKKLEKAENTLWGSSNWLARIDAYLPGGQGSATDHFSPQNQDQAWSTLERMFYKFKPAELTVIRNWTLGDDDDPIMDIYGGEWYGPTQRSQHWTNRVPAAYAPKEAYYRVAGDEVGAVIHREQQKIWEKEGSPDPEESLKEMLETKAEKKAETEANGDPDGSGKDSKTSDDRCNECGGNDCPAAWCNEDAYAVGVSGGIPVDGSYMIH